MSPNPVFPSTIELIELLLIFWVSKKEKKMEPIGAISEGEWSCLSGMRTTEEADFMAQLLGTLPLSSHLDTSSSLEVPISAFWPSHGSTLNVAGANEDSFYPSEITINDLYNFSQDSPAHNTANSILFPTSNQQSHDSSICYEILVDNNSSMSMDLSVEDTTSYLVEGGACLNKEMKNDNVEGMNQPDPEAALPKNSLQLKTESNIPAVPGPTAKDQGHDPSQNCRKRLRNAGDAPKNKRNIRIMKMQKVSTNNNDEESNAGLNGPTSSSCCSDDDDSNASHELSGGASSSLSPKETPARNLDGKARAGRGAATDPQSLYARKRRERINERLRILQNLVPNGTKVDISTMLEEAVEYVKFLQLQIKLLSSDDLWMYAPIAYNGMNIGLDLKVTPTAR